jgi:hypothetical protein
MRAVFDLAQLLRRLDDVGAWRDLAPTLGLGGDVRCAPEALVVAPAVAASMRAGLVSAGHAAAPGFVDEPAARAMASAVKALRVEGLHPVFLYVYDEPWRALGRVERLLSQAMGTPMEGLADFWSWCIDPTRDAGGWPPHRGWYDDVRGPDGMPSLVNLWLSLSSATPRNACMHVVPLDEDPDWPGALARRPFETGRGRALPTDPGDLLVWNANVLHWGGTTDKDCTEARISASFTLARRGWSEPDERLPEALTLADRLDLIANQLSVYGPQERNAGWVSEPLLEWAAVRSTMRALARRKWPL